MPRTTALAELLWTNDITKYNKKQVMANMMKCLPISNYSFINGFEAQEEMITNNQQHIELMGNKYDYGPYEGDYPFRKEYLSLSSIGCCMSNHIARNNQQEGYQTIVFEDDARYIGSYGRFKEYMDNMPDQNDYDVILLSDCTWSSTPYLKGKPYNDHYYYLELPYFDISGTHAYITNPQILSILNKNLNFRLAADDYINFCINTFKLRVLVSSEILFTQRPHLYIS
jgi:hypothetical protein